MKTSTLRSTKRLLGMLVFLSIGLLFVDCPAEASDAGQCSLVTNDPISSGVIVTYLQEAGIFISTTTGPRKCVFVGRTKSYDTRVWSIADIVWDGIAWATRFESCGQYDPNGGA